VPADRIFDVWRATLYTLRTFHKAIFGNHGVAWFQIAMHHSCRMSRGKGVGYLRGDLRAPTEAHGGAG
jgi:hypothetical protein